MSDATYRVVRCFGGYNVHGRRYDRDFPGGRLVFECLHLHKSRGEARRCLFEVKSRAANSHEVPR